VFASAPAGSLPEASRRRRAIANPVFDVGVHHFLIVSFLLVAAGIATILSKRNAIGILIGVELVLNAAGINFVAFNRYVWPDALHGQMFAIFVIVLAAAEAAVALAIFLNFYNNFSSIDVEKASELKG
jgi:NADH-quinone oxidoreductase subunit K